jgi:ATP-dependent DNA helicase RecG
VGVTWPPTFSLALVQWAAVYNAYYCTMMDQNALQNLLSRLLSLPKENEYVEFKDSNHKPEEIGKRISALANGAALLGQPYGYLVFGIEDATHQVVGTTFKVSQEKIGNEEIEFWLVRMLTPRIDFRIYEFEFDEKPIALLQIPASVGQPTLFQNQAYVRVGSYVKLLREFPDKERKLWQASDSDFELEYAKRGVSAAQVVALLDTQSVFDVLLKIPYPTTQARVLEKLQDEKLVARDNGYYHITHLGALLFAKNLADFGLERKAVRVIKYQGKGKLHTEKDQIGTLGYGNGFLRIMNYLSALLPSNEVIEAAIRREVRMYPPLAVRELVANAIVHQDLRERGTYLTIEVYDDRLEISNPGQPVVNPDRFIDGYQARNPLLANAMRRMGFCEDKGSGVDKVIDSCEAYQLPAPDFRTNQHQTIAILFAPQDFGAMNRKDKIRATYQHCSLLHVTNQKMTNQTLRERFKTPDGKRGLISRLIQDTVKEGLIKLEDADQKSRKFVSYVPFWA